MTKNIVVYLHPGYADWEISFVCPELAKLACEIMTVAEVSGPLRSLGGLQVVPSQTLKELSNQSVPDLLVLPGGDSWADPEQHKEVLALSSRYHEQGCTIAAICGAVTGLARNSQLDHIRHTSNFKPLLKQLAPYYKGNEFHTDNLSELDNRIITASGIGAIEFTREILIALGLYDRENANEWFNFFKNGVPPKWLTDLKA